MVSKYNKKIVKHICSLLEKDNYTITEICSLSGISRETYYEWQRLYTDFSDKVAEAKVHYDTLLVTKAKRSLDKMIEGYTVTEKKTITIDSGKKDESGKSIPKIKEQTIIEKHIAPSADLIKFTLLNKTDGEYKNKVSNEITGKNGSDLIPKSVIDEMTDEERNVLLKLAREKKNE